MVVESPLVARVVGALRAFPSAATRAPFWALVLFRVANALAIRTMFVPDEYYQGTEVAYALVFGQRDGALTWEWQPEHRIRSFLHPLALASAMWLFQAAGLDSRAFVLAAPKIIAGVLGAITDWCTVQLSRRMLPENEAAWAACLQLTNWFNWYCGVRCLSNNFEACLVVAALWLWLPSLLPERRRKKKELGTRSHREVLAICIATTSFCVRPTAALMWAPIVVFRLRRCSSRTDMLRFLVLKGVAAAVASMTFYVLLDSWFYGRWTVAVWNFLRFNVFEGGSAAFGTHGWHWYFTQGLPTVLLSHFVLLLYSIHVGCLKRTGERKGNLELLLIPPLAYITGHSFIAHKEFRFLVPCVPMFNILCGIGAADILKRSWSNAYGARYQVLLWATILVHVPVALFFSQYHQGGTVGILDSFSADLHRVAASVPEADGNVPMVVDFLMPCFSAPAYSHLHVRDIDLTVKSLDCSPFQSDQKSTESAAFEADPLAFSQARFSTYSSLPDALIVYDTHLELLRRANASFLMYFEEVECKQHAYFNTDADRGAAFHSACYLRLKRSRFFPYSNGLWTSLQSCLHLARVTKDLKRAIVTGTRGKQALRTAFHAHNAPFVRIFPAL